ncbi:magnesium-dependent phosphatase 1-like [Actinia tenebrosa]|uniref:Magnesium-dependent phosphatase 1-like n=1 Tax=Actinia tenebrosa TaxID=6105 RepID=A0A6P8IDA4_ACTTE|nr:magnesium-dependent phosphatase 1-like [Actinia tenebrosa]
MNKLPKLIVFDLDFTLWPFYVDTHVTPPFSITRAGVAVDKYGYKIELYKEVIGILEWLENKSVKLALASRTHAPAAGKELIQILDIEKFFHYKEIYPGCKVNHFQKFMHDSGIAFTDMLFFDDEERNIRDIKKLGVTSLHVPHGITMALVQEGLELHAQN